MMSAGHSYSSLKDSSQIIEKGVLMYVYSVNIVAVGWDLRDSLHDIVLIQARYVLLDYKK